MLLVSMLNWYDIQLNVKATYLYRYLNETMFMKQPARFQIRSAENTVFLLKTSNYGLRQSGRNGIQN